MNTKTIEFNGKYATWKGLVTTALTCLALAGALVSWGYAIHTSRVHDGAATLEEVLRMSDKASADTLRLSDQARLDRSRIEQQLTRMEAKLDSLETLFQNLNGRD